MVKDLRENKIPDVRYSYRLTHPTKWGIIYLQTPKDYMRYSLNVAFLGFVNFGDRFSSQMGTLSHKAKNSIERSQSIDRKNV